MMEKTQMQMENKNKKQHITFWRLLSKLERLIQMSIKSFIWIWETTKPVKEMFYNMLSLFYKNLRFPWQFGHLNFIHASKNCWIFFVKIIHLFACLIREFTKIFYSVQHAKFCIKCQLVPDLWQVFH